jgi:hypothetical protein
MTGKSIPIPKLHGKTIYEWTELLGPCTMKDIKAYAKLLEKQLELDFDEERIDRIGQNGNTGEHYEANSTDAPST